MPTQEIRAGEWVEFCRRFETLHRGSLVTIQMVDSRGRRSEVARDKPLREARLEKNDHGCSDRLILAVGTDAEKDQPHEVIEPIHIWLRQEPSGKKVLEVRGESGTTDVTFHSGRIGEMLHGLNGT